MTPLGGICGVIQDRLAVGAGLRADLSQRHAPSAGTQTRGGAGIILKFERVRPPRQDAFQPLKAHEITPWFLDRTIRALKRWPIDIVGMDEVCRRASAPRAGRRFVALTFDGGTRDFVDFAYPLLAAHEVPFTLYLPSAFADGLGAMWWLALEQAIATHDRISLIIDHRQRHFETGLGL
jgi:peptidoglycan/xylan/chitin deacetylase (PgdA/CDA1 family)